MLHDSSASFAQGLAMLQRPLLPLVHIVQWLFLSGPFRHITDLMAEFSEPVEMDHFTYRHPGKLLTVHLDALRHLEMLKRPVKVLEYHICTDDDTRVDSMEAIAQWVRHLILVQELESINSLLCAPQGCTLCCTGPAADQQQSFFEIPLRGEETKLFTLHCIDSAASRAASPYSETVFHLGGRPFYAGEPAIYHWQKGWSLILPRRKNCPHLDGEGTCRIYPQRPEVCRRPQIFPYLLERVPDRDNKGKKAYVLRNKLLAVWDCPYVQKLKKEIATYAELCGLEPVFRKNKS